jgi:heme-degrading monooxygenase HmoA
MIVQFVQFETDLSLEEITRVANERLPQFRALKGLRQKYYLKLATPNHYGGFYIWDSMEDLAAFRASELARTIPTAYRIKGAPVVDIHEMLFPLRPEALADAAA